MNLKELSDQYMESAQLLKERIRHLKAVYHIVSLEEAKHTHERILLLQSEYYDLLHTAAKLKEYGDIDG